MKSTSLPVISLSNFGYTSTKETISRFAKSINASDSMIDYFGDSYLFVRLFECHPICIFKCFLFFPRLL